MLHVTDTILLTKKETKFQLKTFSKRMEPKLDKGPSEEVHIMFIQEQVKLVGFTKHLLGTFSDTRMNQQ